MTERKKIRDLKGGNVSGTCLKCFAIKLSGFRTLAARHLSTRDPIGWGLVDLVEAADPIGYKRLNLLRKGWQDEWMANQRVAERGGLKWDPTSTIDLQSN